MKSNRRAFLTTAVAPLAALAQSAPAGMAIESVEFTRVEGAYETTLPQRQQYQVQPLHVYEELRPPRYSEQPAAKRTARTSAIYLKIRTKDGLEGLYGPIDSEGAVVVDRQIKPFLIGKNALAVEALWDQMYRLNRHSRSSHFMIAISAVDNCLWDLRGRYYKTPVYRLLGGPTRPEIEAYGSCLGFNAEPGAAGRKAAELAKQGFRNQKWFIPYGPSDGADGMKQNVKLVAGLREAVGEDVEIMFDAFQGWHLDYAIAWAKQVERYRPRWIEEAFPMERMDSFVKLRQATSVPVATGEHMYGRWEAQRFLGAGAITVVQADPEWCGGVSETVKIATVSSLYDAQMIPHGHSLHAALHVVASQSPVTCPLVEFLITKMSSYYNFEKRQLVPVNGKIKLPEEPGFGIELDPARIEKQAPIKWS